MEFALVIWQGLCQIGLSCWSDCFGTVYISGYLLMYHSKILFRENGNFFSKTRSSSGSSKPRASTVGKSLDPGPISFLFKVKSTSVSLNQAAGIRRDVQPDKLNICNIKKQSKKHQQEVDQAFCYD